MNCSNPVLDEGQEIHYKFEFNKAQALGHPSKFFFSNTALSPPIEIMGKNPVSQTNFEISSCTARTREGNETLLEDCMESIPVPFVRFSVLKSNFVDTLCMLVGWAYFVLWSASFYPQIWLNFRRKSVIGMDFNYVFLNVLGNGSYTIFNTLMYFNEQVQAEYLQEQPYSPLPVLLNDVVFAAHALIFSFVYAFQACIYERGSQRLHPFYYITGVIYIFGSVSVLGLLAVGIITRLQIANIFSYVKILVTTPMYLPQLYFNYTRKSTSGFAIEAIWLDFSGGVLSFLQMVLQAWNVNDWSNFTGNPVKFALALITMFLDSLFFFQHYIIYRNSVEEK
ncbi:unnamed protein product, partial [Mesorhabditis spiculigera]